MSKRGSGGQTIKAERAGAGQSPAAITTSRANMAACNADIAHKPADHPNVISGKIGVLLLNLGTPDATDYWSMRRYLKEFLSDRRVIEEPRLKWWLILNLFILTKRPGPKGKDYDSIWNKERDEGPLKTITRAQADKLTLALSETDKIEVDWAMRYGNPTTQSRIKALTELGCDRILLVPLYPQYAAATTATAADHAYAALASMRWQPSVRVVPPWYDDPVYIGALADSIRDHVASLDYEPEVLVTTLHGMPQKYHDQGDPYYCHCMKTGRLLREALDWPQDRFVLSFQSRFGKDEWLRPYTDKTVMELARNGTRSMVMVAPGFTADCLETLEELEVENRGYFIDNGGEKFSYVPALNDSEGGMRIIEHVVRRELMGWV